MNLITALQFTLIGILYVGFAVMRKDQKETISILRQNLKDAIYRRKYHKAKKQPKQHIRNTDDTKPKSETEKTLF